MSRRRFCVWTLKRFPRGFGLALRLGATSSHAPNPGETDSLSSLWGLCYIAALKERCDYGPSLELISGGPTLHYPNAVPVLVRLAGLWQTSGGDCLYAKTC